MFQLLLEKTDVESRKKADNAYNDLIKFIMSHKKDLAKYVRLNAKGEVFLKGKHINNKYDDLTFAFAAKQWGEKHRKEGRITKASYGKNKRNPSDHWIVFPVIRQVSDLQKLEDLVDYRAFVHEFRHYTMEKVRKTPSKLKPKDNLEAYEDYINTVEELDAHFSESASVFARDLKSMSELEKYDTTKGYKQFLKAFLEYFDDNFIGALTKENYKRFLKWSYNFFQQVKYV